LHYDQLYKEEEEEVVVVVVVVVKRSEGFLEGP
jgi:hypothetical protein